MPTITLQLKEHKGKERIFATFSYDKKINEGIRSLVQTINVLCAMQSDHQ